MASEQAVNARFFLPSGRMAELLEYDPREQSVTMQYLDGNCETVELPEEFYWSGRVEVVGVGR